MSQRLLQPAPAPVKPHGEMERAEKVSASRMSPPVKMTSEPASSVTVAPRYPIPTYYEYRIKPPEFDFL